MRSLALAVVGLSVVACGLFATAPSPSPTPVTASASATPATTAAATATPTPAPTPSPRPNPTAGPGTYVNAGLGYRVGLAAGWRRSECETTRGDQKVPYVETFTTAPADQEVGTDTGSGSDIVSIRTEDAAGLSALQWLSSGRIGTAVGWRFEATTLDGKDAARVVVIATGVPIAYVIPGRGHMHILQRGQRVFDPSTTAAATALMNSFHVLTDAELAGPPYAAPTPGPTRSAEEVADAIAKGFAQKDTAVLQSVASPCLSHAIENAGGSFSSTAMVLRDLTTSFASGLVVTATPRPIDQGADSARINGTWTDPGKPAKNVRFMIVRVGQTWYWDGWIDLQPR